MIATLPRPTASALKTHAEMAVRAYLEHHATCALTLIEDCGTCTEKLTTAIRFEREAKRHV